MIDHHCLFAVTSMLSIIALIYQLLKREKLTFVFWPSKPQFDLRKYKLDLSRVVVRF